MCVLSKGNIFHISGQVRVPLGGNFTPRQGDHIRFCCLYAEKFNHGASGHNDMIIIAKLSAMVAEVVTLGESNLSAPEVKIRLGDLVLGWGGVYRE